MSIKLNCRVCGASYITAIGIRALLVFYWQHLRANFRCRKSSVILCLCPSCLHNKFVLAPAMGAKKIYL